MHRNPGIPGEADALFLWQMKMPGLLSPHRRHVVLVLEKAQVGLGFPFQMAAKVPAGLARLAAGVFVQHSDDDGGIRDSQRVQLVDKSEGPGAFIGVQAKISNTVNRHRKNPAVIPTCLIHEQGNGFLPVPDQ